MDRPHYHPCYSDCPDGLLGGALQRKDITDKEAPPMSEHHFKLSLPGATGASGRFELDGVEVGGVRAVDVRSSVHEFNEVTLHLALSGMEVDGIARLHLAAAQVGLLARFGWTPPSGCQMNERGDVLLTRLTDPHDPRADALEKENPTNG